MPFRFFLFAGALGAASLFGQGAAAWGATGHRLIGRLAIEALPAELPDFIRDSSAIEAAGELAREPDRDKDAGKAHDSERDPAHFIDLSDDGRVLGGPALSDLPPTREAYDTALRAAGSDSWKAGWLPYAILDASQQLTKDFALWRVDAAAAKRASDPARRAWYEADLARRRALSLSDLGALAHFVGDGSQPLHVTVHYNGWGDFPNPDGFSQGRIHARFEGGFVRETMGGPSVRAAMTPYQACGCDPATRIARYLATTGGEVVALYRLQKDGAFRDGDPRGEAFVAHRLAAGASELRDLVIEAWRASATAQVGWPAVSVAEVEAGKVDPWDALYGAD